MLSRNIEQLTEFAEKYTWAMAAARQLRVSSEPARAAGLRSVNRYVGELDVWRATYDERRAEGLALIEDGRQLIRDGESESEALDVQPYLRALRRLID